MYSIPVPGYVVGCRSTLYAVLYLASMVPLTPKPASQGGPGAPTGRVAETGGVGSGGALQLGQVLGGCLFKKVHFPVARQW